MCCELWRGHRIPAYYVTVAGEECQTDGDAADDKYLVLGRSEAEAKSKAATKFMVSKDKILLSQDPDILNTWFFSGLFPFSVLGWPNKSDELDVFYSRSLLETGHEVIKGISLKQLQK